MKMNYKQKNWLKRKVVKVGRLSADLNEFMYDADEQLIFILMDADKKLDQVREILESIPELANVDWEMEINK